MIPATTVISKIPVIQVGAIPETNSARDEREMLITQVLG